MAYYTDDDLRGMSEDDMESAPDTAAIAKRRAKGDAYSKAGDSIGGTTGQAVGLYGLAQTNPYLAGGAAGLMAMEKVAEARQRKREMKAVATNSRISAIQDQLSSMTAAAKGLRI